ncbi:DUF5714 domain-containing protein [Clostridium cylindrosporum]|uniref:SAM-dependent methyltransferase n=1 Tax=Clostridium cylindrosporum DSM 605 TaxID=1121307 RepID=A0A0J8DA10_CLOCY|nr:DUF5714 domain-containing protein [Clostridium cylindrosporum]KMT21154.1 SAM-dependent methyltransferase [Clostridium cylindrosporum DSM 605]
MGLNDEAVDKINKNNCILCGEQLVYSEEYKELNCVYCGKVFNSNVACGAEHYVCDVCHSLSGVDLILSYCKSTKKTNPIEMANDIMNSKDFFMHGPEHHYLVPAVLIASYYNSIGESEDFKGRKLLIAKERAENVKGGFCGFYGSCGAAVGCGIFLSVITSTTPLTKDTWGLVNEGTGRVLLSLAKIGGPRCCKKGVFTSITLAARLLDENMNIKIYDWEKSIPKCNFSRFNKECIGKNCPYNVSNF